MRPVQETEEQLSRGMTRGADLTCACRAAIASTAIAAASAIHASMLQSSVLRRRQRRLARGQRLSPEVDFLFNK